MCSFLLYLNFHGQRLCSFCLQQQSKHIDKKEKNLEIQVLTQKFKCNFPMNLPLRLLVGGLFGLVGSLAGMSVCHFFQQGKKLYFHDSIGTLAMLAITREATSTYQFNHSSVMSAITCYHCLSHYSVLNSRLALRLLGTFSGSPVVSHTSERLNKCSEV